MYDQLQAIEDRYEELGELLSDPEVISDTQRFMQLSKEEANTRDTVETYRRYKKVIEGISDAEELLGENLDAEMKRHYLLVTFSICTKNTQKTKAGRRKSWRPMLLVSADTKK